MTWRYILVLLSLAGLAVAGYSVQNRVSYKSRNDAILVNIGGRQRMLTQQISALVEDLGRTEDQGIIKKYGSSLAFYINRMEKSHNALVNGDPGLGVSTPMDAEMRPWYFGPKGFIDRETREFIKHAKKLLKDEKAGLKPNDHDVSYIVRQASGQFRYSLNKAVNQFQRESKRHLESLQHIELYVLLATIVVLALSAVMVFRPMAKRAEHEFELLEKASVELNQANVELSERTARLAAANETLSDFAHVVSHDLKAPLRAIHNYSDFLREDLDGSLDDEQQSYLNGMTKAITEADRLIDDMLDYSRVSSGESPCERINAGQFIEEIIAALDLQNEVEISVICPGECPVTIETYPTLFRQIIQNLIANAIKYNLSQNKRINIGCRIVEENICEIFVEDNGIGIEEKYFDKIFDIFQRLHTKDEYNGTGIGLAIVRKAAERIGGTIRVESEPGKGSTFYVSLPLRHSDQTKV